MPSNGLTHILYSSFLSTFLIANIKKKKNILSVTTQHSSYSAFLEKGEIPKTGQGIIVLSSGENMALFLIILCCETNCFCCFYFVHTLTHMHKHVHLVELCGQFPWKQVSASLSAVHLNVILVQMLMSVSSCCKYIYIFHSTYHSGLLRDFCTPGFQFFNAR